VAVEDTSDAEDGTRRQQLEQDRGPLEPVPQLPAGSSRVRAHRRRHGRAGRDLPAAIGVGVLLAGLVVVSLYTVKEAFVGVAAVAMLLAVWELANALATREIRPPIAPLVVGAEAMLIVAYTGGGEPLVVAFALTVLGVLVWRIPEGRAGYVRDALAGVFAATYVPFLASFAVLLLMPDDGRARVTTFVLLTVCSDVGGYATGVFLGRHPMAPTVSPKKSWEGFAGSVLACMGGGALAVLLLLDGNPAAGALVGLAAACSATLGDLGESMVKRDLGIKDMGSALPGHGGLMDRLDSLLPTAPVVWLLLSWLVPPPS